ncbi:MAG TPA: hypothetical protein VG435_13195 [Acidimicrobiales bacterium]|nr:hypothetical protein [Acidimicrobiales bacterium]
MPAGTNSLTGGSVQAVSCSGPSACMAVGATSAGSFADQDSGGTWTATELPAGVVGLDSVSCPSSGRCVAVGSSSVSSLSDGVWTGSTVAVSDLDGVSCPAEGSCYVSYGDGVAQLDGSSLADVFDGPYVAVSCTTEGDCVAAGGSPVEIAASSGGAWERSTVPALTVPAVELQSVSCPGVGYCIAVGSGLDSTLNEGDTDSVAYPVVEVERSGEWTASLLPGGAGNATAVSCPAENWCVAVGDKAPGQPVAWYFSDGSWTAAALAVPGLLSSISCPEVGWCQAVGVAYTTSDGTLVTPTDSLVSATMTDDRWSETVVNQGSVTSVGAVSCPTVGYCGLVLQGASSPSALIGWGSSWSTTPSAPGGAVPLSVSCSEQGDCSFIERSPAGALSIDDLHGGRWGPAVASSPPLSGATAVLSCLSPSDCVAVTDSSGHIDAEVAIGGQMPYEQQISVPTSPGLPPGSAIESMACEPAGVCQAVGYSGVIQTFTPSANPGPSAPPVYPSGDSEALPAVARFGCSTAPTHQTTGPPAALALSANQGPQPCPGYWISTSSGTVTAGGSAHWYGDLGGDHLAASIVALQPTPDGGGYYLVGADGGVFAFGDARYSGSLAGHRLAAPIVSMSLSPSGPGYLLVGADGGVFAFGGAPFDGSLSGHHLSAPLVSIVADPASGGYRLFGADGGVFAFDAPFLGSLAGLHLAAPIIGAAASGRGYRMAGADGGVFAFGAPFYGSMPTAGSVPVTAIVTSRDNDGYYLLGPSAIYGFGDAPPLDEDGNVPASA